MVKEWSEKTKIKRLNECGFTVTQTKEICGDLTLAGFKVGDSGITLYYSKFEFSTKTVAEIIAEFIVFPL